MPIPPFPTVALVFLDGQMFLGGREGLSKLVSGGGGGLRESSNEKHVDRGGKNSQAVSLVENEGETAVGFNGSRVIAIGRPKISGHSAYDGSPCK